MAFNYHEGGADAIYVGDMGSSGSDKSWGLNTPGKNKNSWDAKWSDGQYDNMVKYIMSGASQMDAYNEYGGMGEDVFYAYNHRGGKSGLRDGGSSSSSSPISDYQSAYDEAKAANESRYQDILNQYQASYTRNMANLDQYGAQQSTDINNRYAEVAAQGTQDLTSRGLGNTTVTGTMATGVANQASAEQRRLASDIAQQKYTADTALTNTKLGFMERKTDAYPDLNTYLQLAQYSNQGSQGSADTPFAYTIGGGSTQKGDKTKGYSGFTTGQINNTRTTSYN